MNNIIVVAGATAHTFGLWSEQEQRDAGAAGALSDDRNAASIASERCDELLDPAQSLNLVQDTGVTWNLVRIQRQET